MIKNKTVISVAGKEIPIQADSVCIHSDSAIALNYAKKVRKALEAEGIVLCSMKEMLG